MGVKKRQISSWIKLTSSFPFILTRTRGRRRWISEEMFWRVRDVMRVDADGTMMMMMVMVVTRSIPWRLHASVTTGWREKREDVHLLGYGWLIRGKEWENEILRWKWRVLILIMTGNGNFQIFLKIQNPRHLNLKEILFFQNAIMISVIWIIISHWKRWSWWFQRSGHLQKQFWL